jgi:hydroxyacylglutathione hydrolase
MEYQRFVLGSLMTNCYLLWSGKEAGVIDPGGPMDEVIKIISSRNLDLKWILNTHGHADHIEGNRDLKMKYDAPIIIHHADRAMLTSAVANFSAFMGTGIVSPDAGRIVKNGDKIALNNEEFTVIETPGHTPGGISLYTPGLLFSGDALFLESIGRTDFPGGNHRQLIQMIKERLLTLPLKTDVLPGHGDFTTIEHEMKYNSFLQN